jgi:transcriptional regulator with XRE-family HTH domain
MFNHFSHVMSIRKPGNESLVLRERKVFAVNFKSARKQAGLSQEQIAKVTGITQAFLSKVENAKHGITLDSANILADAVGKPLSQLLIPPEK